ncbi:unnamed protein product [Spirodela intermedia]|uniref:C2 domain-containing protein n=1 Tax=Spirodela intermedia TaxID=51605 RepID=A0A7I8IU74_SPIIN|nr:unnamed protein product [Spirodela intermedia]CAA6661515.1 unnamed protein product [Spirodela intermedia]
MSGTIRSAAFLIQFIFIVRLLNPIYLKTKVIKSCLNPVWNQELTFTVTEPVGVLKLEVFDRDVFKADDEMGHAHVSLRPIFSAARLRRALRLAAGGETKLRRVPPDGENCLVVDSSVSFLDGEIVQDLRLRLCDVESGEIELRLKWLDGPSIATASAA